jgi:tetratricopeptide (TPR) repeat protein
LAANYPEALAKWQQGLELAKKSGNQKAMEVIFGTLGAVSDSLGKHNQTLENYQQALTIHRELKDRPSSGLPWWFLGMANKGGVDKVTRSYYLLS